MVFDDEHFVCGRCSEEITEEKLWSVMGEHRNGMPIAVWLIHEQNKDKPFMTIKKE